MTSREKILSAIKASQPGSASLPVVPDFAPPFSDLVEKFKVVLKSLGGESYEVNTIEEITSILENNFKDAARVISVVPGFLAHAQSYQSSDPHLLENVDVAIVRAHFAVAENAALWVTDELLVERVVPFICQHLVVLVLRKDIISTMHNAYDKIGNAEYTFGVFIAGPSKTADIEQSLVLGAHGARTMKVFITADF